MPEVLRAAAVEMTEAAAWYDERVRGLGDRFLLEVESAFNRVDEAPAMGPPWLHKRAPTGVRRMFVRSFPYSVVLRGGAAVGGRRDRARSQATGILASTAWDSVGAHFRFGCFSVPLDGWEP